MAVHSRFPVLSSKWTESLKKKTVFSCSVLRFDMFTDKSERLLTMLMLISFHFSFSFYFISPSRDMLVRYSCLMPTKHKHHPPLWFCLRLFWRRTSPWQSMAAWEGHLCLTLWSSRIEQHSRQGQHWLLRRCISLVRVGSTRTTDDQDWQLDTSGDSSICEIHVDQLCRSNPDGTYRTMYDDDGDHRHYHDHLDACGVYRHDHDHERRHLDRSRFSICKSTPVRSLTT